MSRIPHPSGRQRLLWPAVVIAAAVVVFAIAAMQARTGLLGSEATTLQALEAARTASVTKVMVAITTFGRGPATAAIVILVASWLSIRRHWNEAALLVVANLGSGFLDAAVKNLFARPRPPLEVVTRISSPEGFSFPSGHALSAMVLYTSLAMVAWGLGQSRLKRVLIAAAVAMVSAMGFTRVYLGVHYPSDVIGGWALGAVWVWLVFSIYLVRAQKVPATVNPNSLRLP